MKATSEERYAIALEGIKTICQNTEIFKKAEVVKKYGVNNYIFEALKRLKIVSAVEETRREGNLYTWDYTMPVNETMYKLASRVKDMIKDIEREAKELNKKKKKRKEQVDALKAKKDAEVVPAETPKKVEEKVEKEGDLIFEPPANAVLPVEENFDCDIVINGENITKEGIIKKLGRVLTEGEKVKKISINITY